MEAAVLAERRKKIGNLDERYWNLSDDLNSVPEIMSLLEEFKSLAKETEPPTWYVKFASLYLTYHGKYYEIGPENLETTSEIFDRLVNRLIDRLYNLGAYDMFYSGMID